MSLNAERLLSVDTWIIENRDTIVGAMEEERIDRRKNLSAFPDYLAAFDLNKREYGEMPVCGFWARALNVLPYGFEISTGAVVSRDGGKPMYHTYALRKDGEILCLTPGQFIEPDNEGLNRGDRIRKLQETAPRLVKKVDGLCALQGSREEIHKTLGLLFC